MIGHTLHVLRRSKGVSQDELATVLSVSQQTISAWEKGVVEPDIRCLCALADFFGVSVDYVVGHEVKTDITTQMRMFLDSLTPQQIAMMCAIVVETLKKADEQE